MYTNQTASIDYVENIKQCGICTYFFFLSSNQVFPFVYGLTQINTVHGDFDLSDYIMFTKSVEVKHLQDQGLPSKIIKGDLKKEV